MKNQLLIGLLAICTSIALISCGGKSAKEEAPKKIVVTGSAEMEVVPDEIYMTFTLREYLDAAKSKVKIESIKTAFLAQCKASGIADSNISISNYSGYERWNYYYYRRKKNEPNFMNSISYTVKVNSPANLDKLVAVVDEKALENFNIDRTSHSKMEELRKEVKKNALLAGKNKADYLAKSIGEEIGEALLIQEIVNDYSSDYTNRNLTENMAMKYEASEVESVSSPSFEKIKIRYEMQAEYRLK